MIQSKITIDTDKLKDQLGNLQNAVNKIAGKKANIGVFDPDVADYAATQEFGQFTRPKIPARSFLQSTVVYKSDDSRSWVADNTENLVGTMLKGDLNETLQMVGDRWASYMVEFIKARGQGTWEPLADYTILKKGHDVPLIDRGELINAITCEVM
jgi:hypothetical protein